MTDQLTAYADAYRQSQRIVHETADGLSDDAFNWKPDEKSWSVGECVVHLNTLAEAYLPGLEAALAGATARADGPFRYGLFARTFIASLRPGSRRMPTATAMRPPPTAGTQSAVDKTEALGAFDACTDRFVALIDRADGLDLRVPTLPSPFFSLLRLPVGAYLDALGQHALRHALQASAVTERPGFPA